MVNATSYLEGRKIVTDFISPVGTELCPIELSSGRILAEDLIAAQNVPPFDRSPFDGYVFRAEDSRNASREAPVTLRILEEIPASGVPRFPITAGTASKILTGAPIPEGGDAVVPFEHTEFTEETVTLFSACTPGTNIVRIGEDIRKGSLLTEKGTLIDPGVMGSLAAQNITRPLVYRRPRVAVLATGSELVELGHDLAPGKIHDTNSYSMAGAIRDQGAEPVYYRAVNDSVEAIAEGLEKSLSECDAVVTTGGVSVGDYDLTPAAMEAIGAEIFFRKVDLKPGMACAYGQKNGKLICGLSGNPASKKVRISLAGSANKQGRVAGANAVGGNMLFQGVLGTAILKVGGLTAARTGLSAREAEDLGMDFESVYVPGFSHATYYPDSKPIIMKYTVQKQTGKLLGAQAIGRDGVDKRIDVLSTAIYGNMTVFDLENLDLAYAPPFSSAKDPVIEGGMISANILRGEMQYASHLKLSEYLADPDTVVLDCRSQAEWDMGHVEGAVLLPVDELRDRYKELSKSKTYVVYCGVGYRAYNACRFLQNKGYKVKNLGGGWKLINMHKGM